MAIERMSTFNLRQLGFGDILEDKEMVEAVFRKDFGTPLLKIGTWIALFGGASGLLYFLFPSYYWAWLSVGVFGFYRCLFSFTLWYMNAILMTTQNLVFMEWKDPFNKKTTRVDYWNLDEIQVERIGVRAFLSNFGTLYFMKQNGGELYKMDNVNKPHKVARTIEQFREDIVDIKNFTEESALKDILSQLVESHVREHGISTQKTHEALDEKESEILDFHHHEGADEYREEAPPPPPKGSSKKKSSSLEVEKELDDSGGISIDIER